MTGRRLIVPRGLWLETWDGLRARGQGEREAACVWGGTRSGHVERAEHVAFIDDHGPVNAHKLSHVAFPDTVYRCLEHLRERRLVVVADVHTHPELWVGLSPADAANPIEFRVGLLAFVLPRFALGAPALNVTGVHEYVGDRRWRRIGEHEVARRISIEENG